MPEATPHDTHRDLLDALGDLRRFWERPDRRRWFLTELGAPVELAVLRTLAAVDRAGGPTVSRGEAPEVSVSAVADLLAVSQSTASRLVEQAVRGGYLDRRTATDDRRRTGLALTASGRDLLVRADRIRHGWLAGVTADWEPADVERLAALLRRFLDDAEVAERWR